MCDDYMIPADVLVGELCCRWWLVRLFECRLSSSGLCLEVLRRERPFPNCGMASVLGVVDPPEYVDFLIAVQPYNPRSRRLNPSCMTMLIDHYKIDDRRLNSSYAYPIAMAMALLVKAYKERIGYFDVITYVPAHPNELRRDEKTKELYNHTELLAVLFQEFLGELARPVESLLIKVQAVKFKDKTKEERFALAEKIYALSNKPVSVFGKSILLIDDISTSGATLRACAKILKEAGARRVIGVVAGKTR